MRAVFLLTRVRLRALFSASLRKMKQTSAAKRALMIVLLVVLFAYVGVVFFGLGIGLSVGLATVAFDMLGAPPLYFAFMAALALLLMVLTGMFSAKSQLFEPKDNDLLLSMPLSAWQILLSRMAGLYVMDLFFEAFLLVPALLVWFFHARVTAFGLLFFVLGALLLPLLALALSSFLGWLLALVSARFKNKTLPQALLGVGFMVAYFFAVGRMDAIMESVVSNAAGIARGFQRYVYPLYAFGRGCEGRVLPFLLFAAVCVLPMCLCLLLLSRSFFGIATAKGAVKRKKYEAAQGEGKARSALWAFTCKELRRFSTCAAYMLNGAISVVFLALVGVLLLLRGDMLGDLLAAEAIAWLTGDMLALFLVLSAFLMLSMTMISASAVSLEAKTLWIPLTAPVPGRTFLQAKTLAQVLVCAPFALFFSVCVCVTFEVSLGGVVFVLLLPQLFSLLCAQMGTLINVRFPKFDWLNETVAIKQSLAVFLVMLLGMLAALVFGAALVVFGLLLSPLWGMVITVILLLGSCAGLYVLEKTVAARAFLRLGSHS